MPISLARVWTVALSAAHCRLGSWSSLCYLPGPGGLTPHLTPCCPVCLEWGLLRFPTESNAWTLPQAEPLADSSDMMETSAGQQ